MRSARTQKARGRVANIEIPARLSRRQSARFGPLRRSRSPEAVTSGTDPKPARQGRGYSEA
eukprot:6786072-Alexandrium_andersonii.AAC.1